jgi:uncharacterized protein DUF4326
MARVIHVADRKQTKDEVYIGRGSVFGNPFRIGRDGDRADVVHKFQVSFRARLAEDPEFWYAVQGLRGKTLMCYCKPQLCHGDVIAQYLFARYGDPVTTE